ncbi:hypothetical protein DPMN_073345 [Dreissena polymorpha]|uniref:Uncharacterized protein n=1 Tax=Dreissena polymorpha TaxID=45954 RepID=A0A9D4BYW9_DREPO|nr:hypothetical protein DPMN_073345 [Dreissena polymorpha]
MPVIMMVDLTRTHKLYETFGRQFTVLQTLRSVSWFSLRRARTGYQLVGSPNSN